MVILSSEEFRNQENIEEKPEEIPVMEEPMAPKGLMAKPVQGEM